MKYLYHYLPTAFLILCPFLVSAHDLGVYGKTYEITEPDIRAVIVGQVSRVDMASIETKMKGSTKNYMTNLPDRALGIPDQTHTRYVDVSRVVTNDFYVPHMTDSGTLTWKLIAEKGDRINPLKQIRPVTAFFVINGDSRKQVQLLREVWQAAPTYILPMLASGNPEPLSKDMGMPVYRATPLIMRRFMITDVPAMIYVGRGEHKYQMAVTTFARPWSLSRVQEAVQLGLPDRTVAEVN